MEGISNIVGKLNSNYKPLIVAVFLAIAGFIGGIWCLPKPNTLEVQGFLGVSAPPLGGFVSTPALIGIAEGAQAGASPTMAQNIDAVTNNEANNIAGENFPSSPSTYAPGAIIDPGQPIGLALDPSGATAYTVRKGDSLSGIASYFGISVSDIIAANPGLNKKTIRIGQTLQIITAAVGGGNATLGGAGSDGMASTTGENLPNFNYDFIIPAQGYNWGILHNDNAIDIANSCGTPVVAAAEGLVVPDENIPNVIGGWNSGYGNFVLIEHSFGNGIRTRYAHLEQSLVQVGDYVKQGQKIGLMGESGEATGCHLHFEVIGAQNPFVK